MIRFAIDMLLKMSFVSIPGLKYSLKARSCMKYINEFSISMSELSTHLDMMECYIDSAGTLHGVAIDGLIKNKSGRIGSQSDETYQQKIMIAFFLLRHALELGIKALISEHENFSPDTSCNLHKKNRLARFLYNVLYRTGLINREKKDDRKLYGHDLKKLWKNVNHNYVSESFTHEILKSFEILKKYKLVKDAQLIRYHVDSQGKQIKDLPPIETEDFEKLLDIAGKVRYAVLEVLEAIYQKRLHSQSQSCS